MNTAQALRIADQAAVHMTTDKYCPTIQAYVLKETVVRPITLAPIPAPRTEEKRV